ncbi:MAG: hypothetical protein E7429_05325 [Ruminococcaceae bacterium]|nr:hypothetical protein [Oscillospiraceae bacterium]
MKKERLPTRRKKALRALAGLCVLVLVCSAAGLYGLTPGSALRRQERLFFTDTMNVEFQVRDRYHTGFGSARVFAAGSEEMLMLSCARWTPWRGWQPGFAWPVARTQQAVDVMYAWYSWDPEEGVYPQVIFGCINDAAVSSVTLYVRDWQSEQEQVLSVEAVTGSDGRRYFITETETADIIRVRVEARDSTGVLLQNTQVEDGMSLDYDGWDDRM